MAMDDGKVYLLGDGYSDKELSFKIRKLEDEVR